MSDRDSRRQADRGVVKQRRNKLAPQLVCTVTQKIIDQAVPRDSGYCMLAEAVKSTFPHARKVSVDLQTIRLTDGERGLRYVYLTPRVCQVALVNFDQGIEPEPFTFTLRSGQVTQTKPNRRALSAAEIEQRKAASAKGNASQRRSRQKLAAAANGGTPSKIGGQTPPLHRTAE